MMRKLTPPPSDYGYRFFNGSGSGNSFLISDISDGTPLNKIKGFLVNDIIRLKKDSGLVFKKIGNSLYKMHVIEKDGSESSFCGNGARVFAHYIFYKHKIEIAKLLTENKEINFGKNNSGFFVECGKPSILEPLEIDGYLFERFNVCGEPHLVTSFFFDDNKLRELSKKIQKSHSINVSCIKNQKILTYERGVEDITKSCGSACIAATQYRLTYRSYKNKKMPWECIGGINFVDIEIFSLTGNTHIDIPTI